MKTRKPSQRNARSRYTFACCGARGPLHGSSRAWDAVKHVLPAPGQNYLCWRHSADATFELQGGNVEDVQAHLGISGGFWEALGAPENCALVYAPASFPRNPSCRLHAVGGCAERAVKQHVEWRVCEKRLNVQGFGAVSDLQKRPPKRRSRLHAVRGRPETLSAVYAKTRFGAPVYTPRGVLKNDARVRVLGLGLEALKPFGPAPKTAFDRGSKRQNLS